VEKNKTEESFRFEFDKNSLEKIVLQFVEYRGHQLLDLRVYYSDIADGGKSKPGKKGLTIGISHLDELLEGVTKAVEYWREHERASAGEEKDEGDSG